ncbi:N-acetylmuramoyl-L-alanine amidase [Roseiflexus castenholzii]|uniref:N-acetylmuramoyl-L-alanine amidase n=1 Tax=Roseiflexus castenholzii (strain DSM 13941 / HLO8) TaxID=383372 RepID=A7NFW4_ROSCS|nr:N-acetylmuramoyl-L-alanine amidase [Roseiflexus castenholzii]ABU56345.1 N-acetylmuramyl-L-alanine amidase, negative regulator of AmpC, AmpD [Roseiflexus castenholzii DSM 13941]
MTVPINTSIRSPNYGSRGGRPISMIVLHATAGTARSALAWLTNPAARVSAHYLIDKAGQIYRLVPDEYAAWHAGRAAWRGETAINEVSLGIELENANNGRDPYPTAQLSALIRLTREKVAQYRIAPDMVVRHLDVAVPRGRKNDPAGFPWTEFLQHIFAETTIAAPDRPIPPSRRAALNQILLNEAYRQVGAVEWPDWAMTRAARLAKLGLPVAPSFEVTVEGRNYIGQSFGCETLVSPIAEWKRVDRLSALTAPEHQPLREALLQAIYAQAGETYRPDWAFHQYALREPVGPPLSASFRVRVGNEEWSAAIYALDVLYSPVGRWKEIGRLSALIEARGERDPLAEALLERLYERAGSQWRPMWPSQQYALRERLGAPLGPSFRVSFDGRDYVAEAFALDVLYCAIGEWDNVQRLSER